MVKYCTIIQYLKLFYLFFLFATAFKPVLGPTHALLSNGYQEFFPPWVKQPEGETNHLFPSSAEVFMTW
jgi:hypothetical protein